MRSELPLSAHFVVQSLDFRVSQVRSRRQMGWVSEPEAAAAPELEVVVEGKLAAQTTA